ncbi:hypothetical protein PLESTB_001970100 [Pleodorina starrii]|uniref:Uncharacterized protein n=1 Tax=Pleodorina starrii TaxID=330485 RepID=A0A9W6C3P2_9CHLO|nr:hypothetical protein PLESTB_001970100 [Pleodorina starrii]
MSDVRAYEENIEIRGHLRDTAQPYLTLVLSASPEFFRPAGGPPGSEVDDPEDAARLDAWIIESTAWLTTTFGPDLVSVIYNGDETTPHLHVCAVPTYLRSERIKPRRLIDEDTENHARRILNWEQNVARKRTRSWASNPVVGRKNSSNILRSEYAAAMAPMGLHYSLASYTPTDPDDPVSAREFRDLQKAEAVKARETAEARAAAAEEALRLAMETKAEEDARRDRFTAEAQRLVEQKKAEIAAERAALDAQRAEGLRIAAEERAAMQAEKDAITAERDALRADGAVLEAVVSGLEDGTLTHRTTVSWTRRNDNTLKAAPGMWSRIMPFVRSLLRVQEETEGTQKETLGLYARVKSWLSRDDLNPDARAAADDLSNDITAIPTLRPPSITGS